MLNSAIVRKKRIIFFGPNLSKKIPLGSCIAANPKKYPPANNPRSPAFSPSSCENIGDKVAVLALIKVDIKYASANTKNTTIALFFVSKLSFNKLSFNFNNIFNHLFLIV